MSACASICRIESPGYFRAAADTSGGVIECSPPIDTRNLSRDTISYATRSISSTTAAISPNGSSISGNVKIPTPCTSAFISSSQISMCVEA
jgi:hypothetical protein